MIMHLNDSTLIIIIIGSIIGALKANFTMESSLRCNTVINVVLSVFSGVVLAEHYSENLTIWLSGIVALTGSMLSVSILDTIHTVTPKVIKILIKLRFKIKDDL